MPDGVEQGGLESVQWLAEVECNDYCVIDWVQ